VSQSFCVYPRTLVYVYVYIRMCVSTKIYTHKYICIFISLIGGSMLTAQASQCVCVYNHILVYVYVCVYMNIHTYVYMHIY